MSATLFPVSNSNILYYHHSNSIINYKTIIFSKSFNSKVTTFASKSNDNNLEFENQDSGSSLNPIAHSSSGIKGPTAPWMRGPLLVEPNQVLDLPKSRKKKDANFEKTRNLNDALSGKVSGGRGKKAMKKIYQGIDKLQETQIRECTQERTDTKVKFLFPPGSLSEWGDVSYEIEEENPYGKQDNVESLEGVKFDVLSTESEGRGSRKSGMKIPWDSEEKIVYRRMKMEKVLTAAELNLDAMLLERLRGEAAKIKKWVKVKKAGVTRAVVDQIHLVWKNNELAMLKFDLPLCRNMDRAREIVEVCPQKPSYQ